MLSLCVLTLAGLAAGALNAVAGGGTFISFPALVWLGVPPVTANATATLTALPGYVGSAWGFRNDIEAEGAIGLKALLGIAAVGGLIGALLLTVTSDEAFVGVVPWLLLLATVIFALGPKILKLLKGRGFGPIGSSAALFAVSVYGGYFNGGLGIMLLAAFGLMGFQNLHSMNGMKNVLSALLSLVSAATLAAAGLIAWDSALVLALATTAGGYVGARYARKITNMALLRAGIVAVGAVMTALFFLK